MRKLSALVGAAAIAVIAITACDDLKKTGNQLQAKKVMVATILSTPPVQFSPVAMAGADAGFDAGVAFEGDAGTVTVPPQTAAFVFFGQMDHESLDTPPQPVTSATVSVRAVGEQPTTLNEAGQGNYQLTSQDDTAFAYKSGADYEFQVDYQGATYLGKVTQAPQLERIDAFHPASGYIDHAAGADFAFTRPDAPAGQERNLGFITVFPVSDQGEKGAPTYTNMPSNPLQFLELVALPSRWRQTNVTVPGSAFPNPDSTYVLVLQAVKLGGPESDNLFTGSAILAGTAEVAVLRTH